MLDKFCFQDPEKTGAAVPRRQPPQSAAALRNGVLDFGAGQTSSSIHPIIHLPTSNSSIFQALGNLTAYIPPP